MESFSLSSINQSITCQSLVAMVIPIFSEKEEGGGKDRVWVQREEQTGIIRINPSNKRSHLKNNK